MENSNWMMEISKQGQLEKLEKTNEFTEKYGLALSKEDAELLVQKRADSLKEQQRVEFGEAILPKIIHEFCDSDFIYQQNYAETMGRLQDIFYLYKNEMMDEISDDELLYFMREQFDTVCHGDVEYLESTCLDIFSQAIRAGYCGHKRSDGYGEYEKFDIVPRWEKEIFFETLRNLGLE